MSILIIGMEKPKYCGDCFIGDRTICQDGCPLVEIPEHGSLSPISAEEYTNAVGEFLDEVKKRREEE